MTLAESARTAALRPSAGLRSAPYRAAALAGAALAADVAFDPAHRHVPLCPLHALTGLWCPLCGGLRAADALAHGQWITALHDNALFVAALPLIVAGWLYWVAGAHRGVPRRMPTRHLMPVVVVLAVAFTLVRNLPFATALQPG
jgi:hypothetical protein